MDGFTDTLYNHQADLFITAVEEGLGAVESEALEDVDLSDGVLTVEVCPAGGKTMYFVINKQAPRRQLWLSSPVSGPHHYDFQQGRWGSDRDGHFLEEKLEQELTALLGVRVVIQPQQEE
ncbi:frataxin-like, mitochondrial precursor [Angomonas deanei]|uniref:Frataxin-like domain containing protein, putative n=1 Tax=Angomonas deanei TaxID=59799 RepID=A0A7G2CBS3_9TRYP|nr:frataxin-like, mitochondrial precursor [Angomonas deanei]CAD2217266.1 Frataxin-like domain containing protein, putative [Angomonas deanei]|eukprot:EPY38338.1 frataxin-like, mitochondrial precursor [Angomonas deanei]